MISVQIILRFRDFKNPLHHKLSLKVTVGIVASISCLSLVVVWPNMYYMQHSNISQTDGKDIYTCTMGHYPPTFYSFTYWVCQLVLLSFIPMIIITVTNVSMFKLLGKQPKLESTSEEKKRTQKIKKMSKTFFIVFVTYFMLTLPHGIAVLIVQYYFKYDLEYLIENITIHGGTIIKWSDGTLLLFVFNSCVNAFIYGKAHLKVMKIVRSKCGRYKSNRRATAPFVLQNISHSI